MSAMGHERTSCHVRVMSVFPLKADIHQRGLHVRFVPEADIRERSGCGPPDVGLVLSSRVNCPIVLWHRPRSSLLRASEEPLPRRRSCRQATRRTPSALACLELRESFPMVCHRSIPRYVKLQSYVPKGVARLGRQPFLYLRNLPVITIFTRSPLGSGCRDKSRSKSIALIMPSPNSS